MDSPQIKQGDSSVLLQLVTRSCKIDDPNLIGMLMLIMDSRLFPEESLADAMQIRLNEYRACATVRVENKLSEAYQREEKS